MKKIWIVLACTFLLSGCSLTESGGAFDRFLINPLEGFLSIIANLFNGNYGISIILMTLCIRLLLLPFSIKQFHAQTRMKGKMDLLKPELEKLQEQIKNTTNEKKKAELQQEVFMLYQKNGVNPLNMGCLSLVIQMPILMGVYYAIRGSEEIASHTFLWYSLGSSDSMMALIAGVIYYIQAKLSVQALPKEQEQIMKWMSLASPIMITFISLSAPAALPLYWSISGLFLIGQTMYLQKLKRQASAVLIEATTEQQKN